MSGKILYIHGFASSSNSFKAQQLEQYFAEKGLTGVVLHPTLPVSPGRAIEALDELFNDFEIKLVIGSSLGGFYALYFHQRKNVHTILINPSLHPSKTLSNYIGPVKRHYSDSFFEWTTDHVSQLEQLEKQIDYSKLDQSRLYLYISRDDEILDFSDIGKIFPAAQIKFFDNAKHAFVVFDRILPEIFKLYQSVNQ